VLVPGLLADLCIDHAACVAGSLLFAAWDMLAVDCAGRGRVLGTHLISPGLGSLFEPDRVRELDGAAGLLLEAGPAAGRESARTCVASGRTAAVDDGDWLLWLGCTTSRDGRVMNCGLALRWLAVRLVAAPGCWM